MARYILFDAATGDIRQWGECAEELLPLQERDGLTIKPYDWSDDIAEFRVVSGRVRRRANAELLEPVRMAALDRLDAQYAALMASISGPFGAVHRIKREQAEAGGGPLVRDEAERAAILQKAADQDAALMEWEMMRMDSKAAVRAAKSVEEIKIIMAGRPG